MEAELAGVVRHIDYLLMVFGHNRIPIVSWLKRNAEESLQHAQKAGELVTLLGGHPSLKIGTILPFDFCIFNTPIYGSSMKRFIDEYFQQRISD